MSKNIWDYSAQSNEYVGLVDTLNVLSDHGVIDLVIFDGQQCAILAFHFSLWNGN